MVALTQPVHITKDKDALIAQYASDVPNAKNLDDWKLNRLISACLRDLFHIPKELEELINNRKWDEATDRSYDL